MLLSRVICRFVDTDCQWTLSSLQSHSTKSTMLGRKLRTGTSKTKRLHLAKFEFSLFCMSQWVACVTAWWILYHVTVSCKRVHCYLTTSTYLLGSAGKTTRLLGLALLPPNFIFKRSCMHVKLAYVQPSLPSRFYLRGGGGWDLTFSHFQTCSEIWVRD